MKIKQEESENKGKFFIHENGQEVGLMTYSIAGTDKIIIDHTEVDDSMQGQGLGHKLVKAAVDYAKNNNIKIVPLCPFAKNIFDNKPE